MTFGELCHQTAKECGVGVSYDQMQRILATSYRLILEELILNPGRSNIMFRGFWQIYLKKRNLNCGVFKDGAFSGSEVQAHWCFRIKPSVQGKKVMQGKMDIRELRIGDFPMYFDKETLARPNAEYKDGKLMLDHVSREKKIKELEEIKNIREEQEKQKFLKGLPEDG